MTELTSMFSEEPVKASSKIIVGKSSLYQDLIYVYRDQGQIFRKLELTGALEGELEMIRFNLQEFLDQDDLFVNSQKSEMTVKNCTLTYLSDNYQALELNFQIVSEEYKVLEGKNKIELVAEKEIAPYPINSTWIFPGRVIECKSSMTTTILENEVHLKAEKDMQMGGHEIFTFEAQ